MAVSLSSLEDSSVLHLAYHTSRLIFKFPTVIFNYPQLHHRVLIGK